MQFIETASKSEAKKTTSHHHSFIAVRDSRNRKIRGLWKRNGKYYCQMWVKNESSPRRIPLKEASNLEEAKKEMAKLHAQRDSGELPNRGHKPMFPEYVAQYLSFYRAAYTNQQHEYAFYKSASTIDKEDFILRKWVAHIGQVRIDRVTRPMITSFIDKRLAEGKNPRTANLDLIVLRNVLKKAQDDGLLQKLPTEGIKRKRETPKKRKLLTPNEIESLFNASQSVSKNGQQLYDYLRFLAFSGCREKEALKLKWEDIHLEQKCVQILNTKNREPRIVEFNAKLDELLQEMHRRRAPDSVYLFPSPQRGQKDIPAKTFRESFRKAREKANLPNAGFHDLRHYFASMCVMNGIDFMTTATWLGHKDGGILVGKVYGHLLDEHRRHAAQRLIFTPTILKEACA